jgi:hypothetical protein
VLTEDHGPQEERVKELRLKPLEKEDYQSLFDGQERRKINSRFPGDAPKLLKK